MSGRPEIIPHLGAKPEALPLAEQVSSLGWFAALHLPPGYPDEGKGPCRARARYLLKSVCVFFTA
ncbi:MAG: hypothetical protein D6802_06545 [Ardenticatenia bacterium]|nr:MAG: hypothetical protein D6802_06545 [Ardenticatenia bacterium]